MSGDVTPESQPDGTPDPQPQPQPQPTPDATPAAQQGDAGQAELAAKDQTIHDLEDRLRRALADLDNLRKRHVRDQERERAADRARSAQTWLPLVDNLELALQSVGDRTDPLVEGVRAVHQQAVDTLGQLGFPRFESEGRPFDPTLHEAVSSYPDPENAGTVMAVIRPGYGRPEAILRPAQVVVAVAPPTAPTAQ